MKCVRNQETGEVKRLPEEMATFRVNSGLWSFCPKSEWKSLRVAPVPVVVYTEEQTREITRKVDKKKMQKSKRSYMAGK